MISAGSSVAAASTDTATTIIAPSAIDLMAALLTMNSPARDTITVRPETAPAVPDVAWSYPDPIPENPKIKDLVAFYNERVDIYVDDVLLERPHTLFS